MATILFHRHINAFGWPKKEPVKKNNPGVLFLLPVYQKYFLELKIPTCLD
jgi:hypothetical protein